jgi:aryl-alcohol dehydrogenase-like predicted oxidoreductase
MHYGSIPGVTKPVSRLAQGTATFFNEELLDMAMEFGFTMFDTAHCYGETKSREFGQWMKSRGNRDQVVILAKGAHPYGHPRVTPEDITSDLEATLEWMQVDSVDLFVLHRDDPQVPVGPIVEILNVHQKSGKIGALGGSNWSYQRIQEANDYAKTHNLTPFAVSSPNYSLAEQVEEPWDDCLTISGPQGAEARADYTKNQMPLLTWSSLAGGFFSDRYHRDNLDTFDKDDNFAQLCLKCYCYEPNFQRLDRAREMAQQKGLTVAQIALAFVMSQPMNIFGLVSCGDRAQYEANAAALDVKLAPQELDYLDLQAETPAPRT